MKWEHGISPQDALRSIGFPVNVMTPENLVAVTGVQLTVEAGKDMLADVVLEGGVFLRFRMFPGRGWQKLPDDAPGEAR